MIDEGGKKLTPADVEEILKPDPELEKATRQIDLSSIMSSSSTPLPDKLKPPKIAVVHTDKITVEPKKPARKITGIPSAKLSGRHFQR